MANVGVFELRKPLASGGMGQVWLARHPGRRLDVAIKLVTLDDNPHTEVLLQNEVLAAARLNHPCVVGLVDYGTLDSPLETKAGVVPAGSPYLAMELARGGSLTGWLKAVRQPTWPQIRHILLNVLSGLAHAHAHGVVHRDIKPSNILLDHGGLRLGRLKLGDFGIAVHLHRSGNPVAGTDRAGTPTYMAPEQLLGTTTRFGPATDLYAVGGLAWRLATGRPPFCTLPKPERMRARTTSSPEVFRPRTPVPPGFEAWARHLLAKDPADRPAFAHDVHQALLTLDLPEDFDEVDTLIDNEESASSSGGEPAPGVAAGVGLARLRWIPLLGRGDEFEVARKALDHTIRCRHSQVLQLLGPTGIGKSHLARSICAHAHATGRARYVEADASVDDPVRDVLLTLLSLRSLKPDAAAEQIRRVLPDTPTGEALWLLRWLVMGEDLPVQTRQYLWMEVLQKTAAKRPLIVWVDNSHTADAKLCDWLIRSLDGGLSDAPILFLQVGRTADETHSLAAHSATRRLVLRPLPDATIARMLRTLTGFDHVRCDRIAARAQGTPAMAIQLAHQPQSAKPSTAAWQTQVLSAFAETDETHWDALLAISALGPYFDEERWRQLGASAGFSTPNTVLTTLKRQALLRRLHDVWRVESPTIHHAIRGFGRSVQRWRPFIARIAPHIQAPLGLRRRVLEEAGDRAGALDAALEDAEARLVRSDLRGATSALETARELLRGDSADTEATTRYWTCRLEVMRYRALWDSHRECLDALAGVETPEVVARRAQHEGHQAFHRGDLEAARHHFETATQVEEADPSTVGFSFVQLAYLEEQQGRPERALAFLDQAEPAYRRGDNPRGLASVYASRAHCLGVLGQSDEALRWIDESDEVARQAGSLLNLASNLSDRAGLLGESGRADEAVELLREALRQAQSLGLSNQYVVALNLAIRLLERGSARDAADVLEDLERSQVSIPSERFDGIRCLLLAEAYGLLGHWSSAQTAIASALSILEPNPYVERSLGDSLRRLRTLAEADSPNLIESIERLLRPFESS